MILKRPYSLINFFNNLEKKLSDKITNGCIIENQINGEEATIAIKKEGPFHYTIYVKNNYFDLDIRSPRLFDDLFSNWDIKEEGVSNG